MKSLSSQLYEIDLEEADSPIRTDENIQDLIKMVSTQSVEAAEELRVSKNGVVINSH